MKRNITIQLTKYDYIKTLRSGIHIIVFQKLDGTLRKIIGTLQESLIPITVLQQMRGELDIPLKNESNNVVALYDLQKKEYRAIKLNSIISIEKWKK